MIRCGSLALSALFIAGLLLCGCTGGTAPMIPNSMTQNANGWRANNGEGDIFFYVVYDNPEDEPYFSETFRFRLDGGYVGELDKDRFIETKVSPGDYLLDVDEVDWGGNVTNHAILKQHIKAGDVLFIAAHAPAGQKPYLVNGDRAQGMKAIGLRKRTEPCEGLNTFLPALM